MPFFGCELAFCLVLVLTLRLVPVLACCLELVAFGLVPAALRFEALPAF